MSIRRPYRLPKWAVAAPLLVAAMAVAGCENPDQAARQVDQLAEGIKQIGRALAVKNPQVEPTKKEVEGREFRVDVSEKWEGEYTIRVVDTASVIFRPDSEAVQEPRRKAMEKAIAETCPYGVKKVRKERTQAANTMIATVQCLRSDEPQIARRPGLGDTAARGRKLSEKALALDYPKGEKRADDIAVIIGNADYTTEGKDIPDVVPAYADAESFKMYAQSTLGISKDNIIFMRDATQADLISTFGSEDDHRGQLFNWVEPDVSNVWVYYSGHGAPGDKTGDSYLVPADAQATMIQLNGYPLRRLYRNLSKLPAKSVTVVLEACFSGASAGGSVISNASPIYLKAKETGVPANVTVVAAGTANQIASWEEDKSNGLFTKYFLKGMAGEADESPYGDGNGTVAWSELEAFLKRTLTRSARRIYGRDQTAQIVVAGH